MDGMKKAQSPAKRGRRAFWAALSGAGVAAAPDWPEIGFFSCCSSLLLLRILGV